MCVTELEACLHAVHDELINLGRNIFTTPHLASTPVRYFGVRQHQYKSLGFVNTSTILWGSSTPVRLFGVRQHQYDSLRFVLR